MKRHNLISIFSCYVVRIQLERKLIDVKVINTRNIEVFFFFFFEWHCHHEHYDIIETAASLNPHLQLLLKENRMMDGHHKIATISTCMKIIILI